jgi:hypothetical protein
MNATPIGLEQIDPVDSSATSSGIDGRCPDITVATHALFLAYLSLDSASLKISLFHSINRIYGNMP